LPIVEKTFTFNSPYADSVGNFEKQQATWLESSQELMNVDSLRSANISYSIVALGMWELLSMPIHFL
jgi:hypothetical protein